MFPAGEILLESYKSIRTNELRDCGLRTNTEDMDCVAQSSLTLPPVSEELMDPRTHNREAAPYPYAGFIVCRLQYPIQKDIHLSGRNSQIAVAVVEDAVTPLVVAITPERIWLSGTHFRPSFLSNCDT